MMYTFLKDYTPPKEAAPYLFDLKTTKLIGLKDWVAAQKDFNGLRDKWQGRFQ